MAKNRRQQWNVQLNVLQIFIVLGLFSGFMFLSFGVGFYKGRDIGFDDAMSGRVHDAIPLPVMEADLNESIEDVISDRVYAKLDAGIDTDNLGESEIPTLGKIEEVGRKRAKKLARKLKEQSDESVEDGGAPSLSIPAVGTPVEDASPKTGEEKAETETQSDSQKQIAKAETKTAEKVKKKAASVAKAESKKPVDDVISKSNVAVLGQSDSAKKEPLQIATRTQDAKSKSVRELFEEQKDKDDSKKVEPAAEAPKSTIASGWYAQIAAPKKREDADSLVSSLENSGFDANIEVATVRGTRYFRVLVGPEPNRTLARRLLSQLAAEPYVEGSPFIKRIN